MNKLLVLSILLVFISGLSEGLNQAYLFHFSEVKKVFAHIVPNDEAWTLKYKNGDPKQGAKFFGSTTFLVWTTDPYHFTRMATRVTFMLAFLLVGINRKFRDWLKLLGICVTLYLIWMASFHLIYTLIF